MEDSFVRLQEPPQPSAGELRTLLKRARVRGHALILPDEGDLVGARGDPHALSRMSGAAIGMMVLDEVLTSLDHERRDLMVQAMGRLSNRFHQLFVITHAEQVKDQFPASIETKRRQPRVLRPPRREQ